MLFTQDEIIRMSREAGLMSTSDDLYVARLERFAALVAEATKEKIVKECDPNWRGYFGYQIASALRRMK